MHTLSRTIMILLLAVFCIHCSSSNDEDPGPEPDTNPNPNKITTYNADVKAIIDDQCLRCHTIPLTEGAPFPMRNYEETINGVNRDLIKRIESTGFDVMPPEGRLPQETIDILLDWEADGFLEQ